MEKIKYAILALLLAPVLAFSAGSGAAFPDEKFSGNMHDSSSVLSGANTYVNYCLGCHSLKYQRYNRLAKDTGVSDEDIAKNLIFNGADVRGPMLSSISSTEAEEWFGKVPPDLSLTARAKGASYIYNYLLGFYKDDSKPTGSNNATFPDVGMPNVLGHLEGIKEPVYETTHGVDGSESHHITGFKMVTPGTMSEKEYKNMVHNLTNFLYYVSDPSKIQRDKLGWKVILFLIFTAFVFYGLKRAYWKDVH